MTTIAQLVDDAAAALETCTEWSVIEGPTPESRAWIGTVQGWRFLAVVADGVVYGTATNVLLGQILRMPPVLCRRATALARMALGD